MRIISGTHKGRPINPPNNMPVRPTTDMAKESLFNVLNNYLDFSELDVLDLFAGTGGISFEFASRGAKQVTSVDIHVKCYDFIKKTAVAMNFPMIHTVKANVFQYIKMVKRKYNLIFADPPYDLENIETIPESIFENQLLLPEGWLIIEHSKDLHFESHPYFFQRRTYGKVNFSFFVNSESMKK